MKIISEPTHALNANIWEREAADWYREPKWCSRRLFDDYRFDGIVYDPACGKKNIVNAALDHGYEAHGSDLIDRTGHTPNIDFFNFQGADFNDEDDFGHCHNIVSNPPFDRLEDFALHALKIAKRRVALIFPIRRLPAAGVWLEGTPLKYISYMTPRPSIPTGQVYDELEAQGKEPSGGTQDFAWLLWDHSHVGDPTVKWLHRDALPLTKDQRL
jgi:hypothetical protein